MGGTEIFTCGSRSNRELKWPCPRRHHTEDEMELPLLFGDCHRGRIFHSVVSTGEQSNITAAGQMTVCMCGWIYFIFLILYI